MSHVTRKSTVNIQHTTQLLSDPTLPPVANPLGLVTVLTGLIFTMLTSIPSS